MPPLLYNQLAEWWPLLSPPENYEEEAGIYLRTMRDGSERPIETCLELGSGGGNNASWLKRDLAMTLVEPSEGMRAHSRKLNPECEHHAGDMRTVRLERTFDAVFVHDAVCYMLSLDDLRRAVETAWIHCAPGGVALFCPDHVRDTFRSGTGQGGADAPEGGGLRYLSWTWDPDPGDTQCVVDYAFLLRSPGGEVRAVHDRHDEGLFSTAEWLRVLSAAGFEPSGVPLEHSELEDGQHVMFVGRKVPSR
jgi:SAM-dependent methyltransferase